MRAWLKYQLSLVCWPVVAGTFALGIILGVVTR